MPFGTASVRNGPGGKGAYAAKEHFGRLKCITKSLMRFCLVGGPISSHFRVTLLSSRRLSFSGQVGFTPPVKQADDTAVTNN